MSNLRDLNDGAFLWFLHEEGLLDGKPSSSTHGSPSFNSSAVHHSKQPKKNEDRKVKPGPNDWKWGCGCLSLIVVAIIAIIIVVCHMWFHQNEETTNVQCDTASAYTEDTLINTYMSDSVAENKTNSTPDKKVKTTKTRLHSYSSDDDEYDEDGMYKDEDEDIKEKREYDSYDDDEADDWE